MIKFTKNKFLFKLMPYIVIVVVVVIVVGIKMIITSLFCPFFLQQTWG